MNGSVMISAAVGIMTAQYVSPWLAFPAALAAYGVECWLCGGGKTK